MVQLSKYRFVIVILLLDDGRLQRTTAAHAFGFLGDTEVIGDLPMVSNYQDLQYCEYGVVVRFVLAIVCFLTGLCEECRTSLHCQFDSEAIAWRQVECLLLNEWSAHHCFGDKMVESSLRIFLWICFLLILIDSPVSLCQHCPSFALWVSLTTIERMLLLAVFSFETCPVDWVS